MVMCFVPCAGASNAYPSLHVQHMASQEWDGAQKEGQEPYATWGRSIPGEVPLYYIKAYAVLSVSEPCIYYIPSSDLLSCSYKVIMM